jgi:apolipoprotein D and lipocalin family protein
MQRHPSFTAALAALALCAAPAAWASGPAPPPLPELDLAAYMGRWHQVALFPNRFQKQCLDSTTATYTLLPEGQVRVLNRCRTASGWDEAEGRVRLGPGAQRRAEATVAPAVLEVSFLPAALRWLPVGWGAYHVLHLGPPVSSTAATAATATWAIVGEPSREFLWVLSRPPTLEPAQWQQVEAEIRRLGYDPARLQRDKP